MGELSFFLALSRIFRKNLNQFCISLVPHQNLNKNMKEEASWEKKEEKRGEDKRRQEKSEEKGRGDNIDGENGEKSWEVEVTWEWNKIKGQKKSKERN